FLVVSFHHHQQSTQEPALSMSRINSSSEQGHEVWIITTIRSSLVRRPSRDHQLLSAVDSGSTAASGLEDWRHLALEKYG
ncbi:hypothetical protein K443DRAFT_112252, partial [Laccaria amethystina LaAM-08-1]